MENFARIFYKIPRNIFHSGSTKMPVRRKKNIHVILMLAFSALAYVNGGCDSNKLKSILRSDRLVGINLSGFDLYRLDLEKVNFTKARLIGTNFSFANLRYSKFTNADLRRADLSAADLTGSDLRGANMRRAVAENAIFRRAEMADAYLYGADLSNADLRDAYFVAHADAGAEAAEICEKIIHGKMTNYTHLRNADCAGAAINSRWKCFIQIQGVRNFDKIVWVK
jgi:uncharacterized protein YjbI with pentapeptide repeats